MEQRYKQQTVLVEKHGVMTKEEFKSLWEANDEGSGLTWDDIADNAKAWGLYDKPRCCERYMVRYKVLKAAGVSDADSYKPKGKRS